MRLHHVNVVVPVGGTESVVEFYTGLLRFTRFGKPAGAGSSSGAWFDIGGGGQLHVSERDGETHPEVHFAVQVDDFDATLRAVQAAGHPWTPQPDLFGGRRGFTRDPAGNRVELLEGGPAG